MIGFREKGVVMTVQLENNPEQPQNSEKRTSLFREHLEFIILMVTLIGVFVWVKTESRADFRSLDSKIDTLITEMHAESMAFHAKLSEESKDFHGRLCTIEEKYNHLEKK